MVFESSVYKKNDSRQMGTLKQDKQNRFRREAFSRCSASFLLSPTTPLARLSPSLSSLPSFQDSIDW